MGKLYRSAKGVLLDRFVVISGCSGGGKSALLAALSARGFATVDEPGRRIVRAELDNGGSALPWLDSRTFAQKTLQMAIEDMAAAASFPGWVFFDRGLIDAAANLQFLSGKPVLAALANAHRYHRRVFLTPPWREIYVNDDERRHGFDTAVGEYRRLQDCYPSLGYEVEVIPKDTLENRVAFVLNAL